MYDLQISDDVATLLTADGVCRLALSANSRRLTCCVCDAPLGSPDPPTSVIVLRDPRERLSAVRLAHAHCARPGVREEAIGGVAASGPPGQEWNLLRRPHPRVPAVLAWETDPPFERPPSRLGQGLAAGPLEPALRRSRFTDTAASLGEIHARTNCRLTLGSAGRHLVLARDGRRWLEFSEAAASEGARPWLDEAYRAGRALLLFGPGLGGEALSTGGLSAALHSGLVLSATVRVQRPREAAGAAPRGDAKPSRPFARGIAPRRTGRRGLSQVPCPRSW